LNNVDRIISSGSVDDVLDEQAEAGLDAELRAWVAGASQHGHRLDRTLAELVPEFSRSYLQQLIGLGAVTLNGGVITKPATRVKVADTGTVELRPTPQSQAFKAESMALNVVYQDEHVLVINKPANLVVHPAPGNWSGTLLNGLLAFDVAFMDLPRAGIVHRLDKDTSGLMVVARSRLAMDALVRSIAARDVQRHYLALAHRQWVGAGRQEVQAAIGRDPRNRLRMSVVDLSQHAGKAARTDVELLQNAKDTCLVKCALHTGRTHQIRVHMAWLGHPLLADETYGGADAAGMNRQALHAVQLAFNHPVTGQALSFRADLPKDFRAAMDELGLRYNLM
jgi:23S rRNA pseudouridine1911/1915/1917 synthase